MVVSHYLMSGASRCLKTGSNLKLVKIIKNCMGMLNWFQYYINIGDLSRQVLSDKEPI